VERMTGSVTVTASGTGKTITATKTGGTETGTSNTFDVNPGMPLCLLYPLFQCHTGHPFDLTVTAMDAYNNVATGILALCISPAQTVRRHCL